MSFGGGARRITIVGATIQVPVDLQDVHSNAQPKAKGQLSEVIQFLPSGVRTTSGTSATFDLSNYKEIVLFLNVTAVSGTTPTLDCALQTQDPVSLEWFDIVTFAQKTAVGKERQSKADTLGSNNRINYVIGGTTPSFTLSLIGVPKG